MDQKDMYINSLILQEFGLQVGDKRRVIDPDTGTIMQFKGRDIVAPDALGGKHAIEFDPYNNTRLMNRMFGYYVEKIANEDGLESPGIFYNVDDPNGKRHIVYKSNDGEVTSDSYMRESLCYLSLLTKLNGSIDYDLSEYDVPMAPPPSVRL